MNTPPSFRIADRPIGAEHPAYVIAEMSANHLGDYQRAVDIVHAAADAGADAIKLQTYTPETITLDCDDERFKIGPGTPWAGRSLADIYREAMTPWDWHAGLFELARERGMHAFSSPFDPTAVAFLEELDVPAYKIASFELVDVGLIACAAATGKPLIMSTGMATVDDIHAGVDAARTAGAAGVALLKCTSAYPAPPDAANLRAIPALEETFGVVPGLSDHTMEETVVVTAIALGARIVEKHLTLARADGGPDGSFSLEPEEFAATVRAIRTAEAALGKATLGITEAEQATNRYRRSLFFVSDVAAGTVLGGEHVRSIRPADGLAPKHLEAVLGRRAAVDIARGTPVSWDLLADDA